MHFPQASGAHAFRGPEPSFPSSPGFPSPGHNQGQSQTQAPRAPSSGFRVPLTTDDPFPASHQAGQPPCVRDLFVVHPGRMRLCVIMI